MTPKSRPGTALLLAAVLCLGGCCRAALAQETQSREPVPSPEASAHDLAAEVLREAGNGGLGDWTREVIGRALERTGEAARETVPRSPGGTASPAPLPAERHSAALAGSRPDPGSVSGAGTPELLVFTSLSAPAASWRQWARDAARTGAPLVLRGVAEGSLRATVKQIGQRLGGHDAGVAIDPRLFRLFGIERVPAVVVVPGGVPPCRNRGCSGDAPPPFDLVTGNIGLAAALEAVADEGADGRPAAQALLERLRGNDRP